MIPSIVLRSSQSEFSQFAVFVTSDGGFIASPSNATALINLMASLGLIPLLLCTCDAGKELKLYTILP